MDFILNNYDSIVLLIGAVYPPILFLLPVKYANKIDVGVKIIKAVADSLDKLKNSKSGFSFEQEKEKVVTYYQKSKSS